MVNLASLDYHATAAGAQQAAQDAKQGRLAGPRWTFQCHDLAAFERERNPAEDGHFVWSLAVGLDDVVGFEHGHGRVSQVPLEDLTS